MFFFFKFTVNNSHWYTANAGQEEREAETETAEKKGRHSVHSAWTPAKSHSQASYTSTPPFFFTFIIFFNLFILMMFIWAHPSDN